jgi:hypothetical protein
VFKKKLNIVFFLLYLLHILSHVNVFLFELGVVQKIWVRAKSIEQLFVEFCSLGTHIAFGPPNIS